MRSPCDGQAHFVERDFRVFVEQGHKALFPLRGRADLAEPVMADGEHETDLLEAKGGPLVPEWMLVLAWKGWRGAKGAVPHTRMMSAGVSEGEDSLHPRAQQFIRKAKVLGGGREHLWLHGIRKLEQRLTRHQLAGHPQRQVLMFVAVVLLEMLHKGIAGPAFLVSQLGQPQVVVGLLKSLALRKGFEVSPGLIRPGSPSEAWQLLFVQMAEWTMGLHKVVNQPCPHGDLDALNGVQEQDAESAIKVVAPPDGFQSGAGDVAVIRLPEGVKVAGQPVVVHDLQPLDQLIPVCHESTGQEEVRLLLQRQGFLGIDHRVSLFWGRDMQTEKTRRITHASRGAAGVMTY